MSASQIEICEEDLPLPISSDVPEGAPFPLENLGPFSEVANDFAAALQVPVALAAQSVLAAAAFAVQNRATVQTTMGIDCPLSLSLISIVESGSRKSYLDNFVFQSIRKHELKVQQDLADKLRRHDEEEKRFTKSDIKRLTLGCLHVLPNWTFRNAFKNLHNLSSNLLFSSDDLAHAFEINTSRPSSHLSISKDFADLWSGNPIFVINDEFAHSERNRRITYNLSIDHDLSSQILKRDRNSIRPLLERSLITWPESFVGKRMARIVDLAGTDSIRKFHERIAFLLDASDRFTNEIEDNRYFVELKFQPDAEAYLMEVIQYFEEHSTQRKDLGIIFDFTERMSEHIARIAGIATLYENPKAKSISRNAVVNASHIVNYYISELWRMQHIFNVPEAISDAMKLLPWLQKHGKRNFEESNYVEIGYRFILQRTHPSLRSKSKLDPALKVLHDHRWIRRYDPNQDRRIFVRIIDLT